MRWESVRFAFPLSLFTEFLAAARDELGQGRRRSDADHRRSRYNRGRDRHPEFP
jgi:hypothetical protein